MKTTMILGLTMLAITASAATKPATAPATKPALAGPKVDLSVPERAIEAMVGAVERGDLKAVQASFHAPTKEDRELADAVAGVLVAGAKMQAAVEKQYGLEAAKRSPFDITLVQDNPEFTAGYKRS